MTYLKLFANCIPVKGAKRSIICDLQRNSYHFIPNDLHDVVKEACHKSVSEIKAQFSPEDQETVDEYLQFIVSEGYGFFCDEEELALFPPVDLTFDFPGIISNAIIDIDENLSHDFGSIFEQLEDLGCKDIELRFFSQLPIYSIIEILNKLNDSRIRSVELLIQDTAEINEETLVNLCRKNLKILKIIVSNSSDTRIVDTDIDRETKIIFTEEVITDSSCCGNITRAYFSTNLVSFAEAVNYNSCLNRKISIDSNGNIKNCPSLSHSYGTVKDTSLKKALNHSHFKSLWSIKKDQIEVCKDCEFRYICSDCRAYVEGDIYSKPSKCGYDPYSASWQT